MSSPAFAEAERTGVHRGYEIPGTTSIITTDFVFSKPDVESVIDRMEEVVLRPLLVATSREEFKARRDSLFSRYAALSSGLREMLSEGGDIADHINSQDDDHISCIYSLIRNSRLLSWPEGGADEAIFCIETLERAQWLVSEIVQKPLSDDSRGDEDKELAREYGISAFWSQMHIDCLVAVLLRRILALPSAEVLDEIVRGMRLSVMSYASARQGYELRYHLTTADEPYPADPEDADALASSHQISGVAVG
jgi:hypothetical protein